MLLSRVKSCVKKERHLQSRHCLLLYLHFFFFHTNSTCCIVNGQPTPPNSIKKYRKF